MSIDSGPGPDECGHLQTLSFFTFGWDIVHIFKAADDDDVEYGKDHEEEEDEHWAVPEFGDYSYFSSKILFQFLFQVCLTIVHPFFVLRGCNPRYS